MENALRASWHASAQRDGWEDTVIVSPLSISHYPLASIGYYSLLI